MIRWPGVIKPGTIINDIGAHEDMIPTLLAAVGDTTVKEDLLKGKTIGDMTYKVHLDGYNLIPALKGEGAWPRHEFLYFTDDGNCATLRYDRWKISFLKQDAHGLDVWRIPHRQNRRLFHQLRHRQNDHRSQMILTLPTKHKQTITMKTTTRILALACASPSLVCAALHAQEADLAQKLANPIADLISLPIQSNYDFGVGPGDGTIWRTNIQPVIPFGISDDWNVISRTILPVIDQEGLAPAGDSLDESGLGDITQSFFFSPKESSPIWGVGPVFLIPSATDELLGTEKFGIGPTAVVLRQTGPWTYGALANHLWDVVGDSNRASVNATFLQPFLSYILPTKTTLSLNTETTYDWSNEEWTVPLNFQIAQLFKVGDQPMQAFIGARYYADKPTNGPEWGLRLGLTFLFPK